MERAWKLLTASHAHDSICSCNCDEVNDDVLHRLTEAGQLAREVEKLEQTVLGSQIRKGRRLRQLWFTTRYRLPEVSGSAESRCALPGHSTAAGHC